MGKKKFDDPLQKRNNLETIRFNLEELELIKTISKKWEVSISELGRVFILDSIVKQQYNWDSCSDYTEHLKEVRNLESEDKSVYYS